MGISASKSKTIQTGWVLSVAFEETGTSTPNNTSNIYCSARLAPASSLYYFDYTNAGDLSVYWHDNRTNSDTWVAGGTRNSSSSSSNATCGGTITAAHNADGTLSGYAWAKWTKKYNSQYIPATGNVATDWKALTNIPRKSKPTVSDATIAIPATAGSITISTNRATTSFTHTIVLTIGATEIARETNVGATVTFAIPDLQDDIFAAIPNATSATINVSCETFNGSTSLGTESTSFVANVTADAKPTFSNYTYADTNATTTAITGNNQILISGKSTLAVTISTANKATANYHATMSTYSFTINAQSATEAYTTSQIVKNLGTVNLESTITENTAKDLVVAAIDSRGLNKSVTKNVVVIPWRAPIINATATRQNGFENTTTVAISGSCSPLIVNGTGKNSVNATSGLQYRYKNQNTTTWGSWTNVATTYTASTGAVSASNFTLNLDNQAAFDMEFKLTDALGSTTVGLTVSAGQPAMYIGADDRRVSIGGMPTIAKVSGKNGQLEVLGNAYANGNRLAELPITTAKLANTAVTGAKIDWTEFALTQTSTTNTFTPSNYIYSGDTYLTLRQNANGHIFHLSGRYGWWRNADWSVNKTSIGSGKYGFKTNLRLNYHPSSIVFIDYLTTSWNWVPGGDPGRRVDGNGNKMSGIAIDTDGYIWVDVDTTTQRTGSAWWRIGAWLPGVTFII